MIIDFIPPLQVNLIRSCMTDTFQGLIDTCSTPIVNKGVFVPPSYQPHVVPYPSHPPSFIAHPTNPQIPTHKSPHKSPTILTPFTDRLASILKTNYDLVTQSIRALEDLASDGSMWLAPSPGPIGSHNSVGATSSIDDPASIIDHSMQGAKGLEGVKGRGRVKGGKIYVRLVPP